jgi:phosphinothricin acetyltransferase
MKREAVNFVDCDERHAPAILAIFNDAIVNTTVVYDYVPRPPESMDAWFAAKRKGNFPVIGIEAEDSALIGFATYGSFRHFPAYKYSVEHSVYVEKSHRGKGLGRILLQRIIEAAQAQDYHTMIGVIDSENAASMRLHEAFGFEKCATLREVAFKFNRWLDIVFYQKILPTPEKPVDEKR